MFVDISNLIDSEILFCYNKDENIYLEIRKYRKMAFKHIYLIIFEFNNLMKNSNIVKLFV